MDKLKEIIKARIDKLQDKNIEHMLAQEIYEDQGKRDAYIDVLHLIHTLNL